MKDYQTQIFFLYPFIKSLLKACKIQEALGQDKEAHAMNFCRACCIESFLPPWIWSIFRLDNRSTGHLIHQSTIGLQVICSSSSSDFYQSRRNPYLLFAEHIENRTGEDEERKQWEKGNKQEKSVKPISHPVLVYT